MSLQFLDPETTQISGGEVKLAGPLSALGVSELATGIGSSKTTTGIELRMLPPLIKDNHTPAVWPFPGFSKLYCLTIVVSDVTNQLAGTIDLKGFQRIGDNETLPINKTIFYWQSSAEDTRAPNQIHVMCTVIKSKQSLRDIGEIMSGMKNDTDYKDVIATLGQLASNAAKLNVVTDLMLQIAGIAGKYLGKVEDKALGTVINSYTTLYGDFDKLGITQLVYPTRDVDFEFQLIIRDQQAENDLSEKITSDETISIAAATLNLGTQEEEAVDVEMQPL